MSNDVEGAFDVRVLRARRVSPTVRELVLLRADGAAMDFAAGQCVSLSFRAPEGELRRWFSIASPPDGSSRFTVAIRTSATSALSAVLDALPDGSVLRALGPRGALRRDPLAGLPALFVGTGTGIAPLLSMITDAAGNGESSPLVLLLGVREADERLYADELRLLEAAVPNFAAHYTLSQPPDGWSGLSGYVQEHVPRFVRELDAHGPVHVYLCGSPAMVGAVRDLLRNQLNVPAEQVHEERYG